ncbi:MAG TPA: aminoglycoside phosphotransferase [Reyranella sp.]|nr:aminoglycoside phosphotransferase [Reyranella sp.]
MDTHAPPQADADYLTAALRKSGALDKGRVVAATVVHTFPTILSKFHRLKLDYEGAEDAPRHVYLKTSLPGSAGATWGHREVAFYTTVAPATPTGLLPRCFDAEVAANDTWHLLLEDLTDTHAVPTQWPVPPTVAQTEAIMRCRARFQAAWWDHPRLGIDIDTWPTPEDSRQWLARMIKQYEAFAHALGERLPAHRRELYERLFANAPKLAARTQSHRNMTIIQGDAHVWNCFLPKEASGTPRLFDWDAWRPAIGAEDLAYMIAMHWYPDMRRQAEGRLLDTFHEELMASGVAGYSRRDLQDDYRFTVLWQILGPIWRWAAKIPPVIWWNNLERIHLAADDLGCRELLD